MSASEITLFAKSGGPLTKRISLAADGSLRSDRSACVMAHGQARRARIAGIEELAALIDRLHSKLKAKWSYRLAGEQGRKGGRANRPRCPPLSVVEESKRREARATFVSQQAKRLAERKGISAQAAARALAQWCEGVLLPDVVLPGLARNRLRSARRPGCLRPADAG